MRIYIVEDSRLLSGALKLHIEDVGGLQFIGQSGIGKRATQEIIALAPDLVLLDINLAEGDGFQVLAEISRTDRPALVAMMTFEPSANLRQRAAESGADLFFDKASEAGALLDLLQNLGKGEVTPASLRKQKPGALRY